MSATTALVVDDLKMFLEVARLYLERRGFQVLTAENGAKAVELARARHPRLILLDLLMPAMDGAEACAAMRRDPTLAFTPIVIMSATGGPEIRQRCLQAGCSNFVVKPSRTEDLLGVIARILSVRERKVTHTTVIFGEVAIDPGPQLVGKAGNISGTGMLLLSGKPIRVGSLLQLEFVLPNGSRTVRTKAKVLRVSQDTEGTYGAGLHFMDLDPDDQQQIVRFVSS
jgi:CheY-like chemotaxis protein